MGPPSVCVDENIHDPPACLVEVPVVGFFDPHWLVFYGTSGKLDVTSMNGSGHDAFLCTIRNYDRLARLMMKGYAMRLECCGCLDYINTSSVPS